jgi:hypothetical protein
VVDICEEGMGLVVCLYCHFGCCCHHCLVHQCHQGKGGMRVIGDCINAGAATWWNAQEWVLACQRDMSQVLSSRTQVTLLGTNP